jgi:hypothetical protein
LRRVRTNVRGDVDYRECESQVFSRFTALFVEADTKQSIVQPCNKANEPHVSALGPELAPRAIGVHE